MVACARSLPAGTVGALTMPSAVAAPGPGVLKLPWRTPKLKGGSWLLNCWLMKGRRISSNSGRERRGEEREGMYIFEVLGGSFISISISPLFSLFFFLP